MENSIKRIILRLLCFSQIAIGVSTATASESCLNILRTSENLSKVTNENNHPVVTRNGDMATVSFDAIRTRIINAAKLKNISLDDLTVSIFVNGKEEIRDLNFKETSYKFKEARHRQIDYYIVYKYRGKIFDISNFHLKESKDGQNVNPQSFKEQYSGELFGFNYGKTLKKKGISAMLSKASVKLGYGKVVWVLSPDADPALRAFVESANLGVDVKAEFNSRGYPSEVIVTDRETGKQLKVSPKNFFFKVDAAFSGNAFFWDDMLVALATVPYHPWLAASTIDFWLMVQSRNGGVIPREVRKENLISLWFPQHIKNGEEPKANLTFTNPNLMNWAMRELYKFDPSRENLVRLRKVSDSVTEYTQWMEANRAVKDENGDIIGFNGSALGTGLDNSRGEIGNRGENRAYQTGFVDFISQQISMLKDQSEWNIEFSKKTQNAQDKEAYLNLSQQSKEKAQYYEEVLNEKYYNEELKFYFDLVPDGRGGHVQNTAYHSIAGFWPVYAKAVPANRLTAIIERQFQEDAFGGEFPLPANARHAIDSNAKVEYKPRGNKTTDEDGYWDKWAHWPSMAMVVIEGFRISGRPDVAHKLAASYLKKMAESSELTVEENYGEVRYIDKNGKVVYQARVGQHASHPHRADFAGWGKGPPIYLALLDVMGISAKMNKTLSWELRSSLELGEDIGISNLQYNGVNVEKLEVRRIGDKEYEVTVSSNSKFKFNLATLVNSRGEIQATTQDSSTVMEIGGGKDLTYRISLR